MTGVCFRCGARGPVEYDHPIGRYRGVPLEPAFSVPLCRQCHVAKGRLDRAADVEGGRPSPRRVVAALAAWFAFHALTGVSITFTPAVLGWLARVLEAVARLIPPHLPWPLS